MGDLIGLILGIGFILFFVFSMYIKKVPANTVRIIDRNSHYLKTKKSGFYFFNPVTDKVTTEISRNYIQKVYYNYYETHDGAIVNVSYSVKYHAEDIDKVLKALELVRRSVDDVIERFFLLVYQKFNDFGYQQRN